jgi:hypothetical protein
VRTGSRACGQQSLHGGFFYPRLESSESNSITRSSRNVRNSPAR